MPNPEQPGPRWYVCHTKPRCEKKFSKLLMDKSVEHYLPLLKSSHKYPGSGTKHFSKPLFPSYVFGKIDTRETRPYYERQLLVRFLWVEDQERFLRQLESVKRILEMDIQVGLEPLFEQGQIIRIKAGPFKGIEAVIDNPHNPKGIQVVIEAMDRALHIPLNPAWLV